MLESEAEMTEISVQSSVLEKKKKKRPVCTEERRGKNDEV